MTKQEMLEKMDENHWGHESDENSSYEEVKEEYDEIVAIKPMFLVMDYK